MTHKKWAFFMVGWLNGAADRVVSLANRDKDYQELLEQCSVAEEGYHKIMGKLSEEEWLRVDDYIALCEEIQYQMTQLAYEVGLEDGVQMGRAFRKIVR